MIHYRKDTNNIVTLIFDMKGRHSNVINHEIGEELMPVIKHLQEEKKKGVLRGIIITSAKRTFLAGGDLQYLYDNANSKDIFEHVQLFKKFFRDLESPGVPVVAAINGTALGAGFELALACHHRIVIDRPKIKVGLPEITLGLMPSGGATIRLMWLLGIKKAYKILTSRHWYSPKEALRARIIDDLASDEKDMMDKAKTWLLQTKEGRRPWDITGETIPDGTANELETGRQIARMTALLTQQTYNNFPAYQSILNVLAEGSKVDFDTACRIESRFYTNLLGHQTSKNMIKTFWFDVNAIKNGLNRPKGFGKFRPKKVGVIGSGMMGSGITYACAVNGMQVVLKDISKLIAERGREYAIKKLNKKLERQEIEKEEKDIILSRITTTETSKDFEDCDLVIEAVFENRMVKQKVTKEAEQYIDKYSIFGTNTVSIPITRLAEVSVRPENYVGLHFFHPADEVPMVEIVKGKTTSDETISRAFDFVKAIRKTPIIVKDDWGFYVARVQNTYILEGITMLQEGYAPALIENLGRQVGMPKGALALADELSLPLVLEYEHQAAEHYGAKYLAHPAVKVLTNMTENFKRLGKSKFEGFYEYKGDEKHLWTELTTHYPITQKDYSIQQIKERFLFAQVIEAVWCLQEKVISSIPEANLGSIYGWGFPAFKGGVIQYISDYGKDAFITKCELLKEKHGPRFTVPSLLRKLEI